MPRVTGSYESTSVAGETTQAFVPHALPPARPGLKITGTLKARLEAAEASLSRLEAAGRLVPSLDCFVYSFVRKEAVISSQIEGTQASLTDLLTDEAEVPTGAPPGDVEEICNYLDALSYAREQLRRPKGLPLSLRLLNGTHRRLMTGARGRHKGPGLIRRSQNWIGGTRPGNARFVPPPPHRVPQLLGDLERFLHEEVALPALIKTGLAQVQFETIHPYLDGNGRVGRLLIALCLENWGLLTEPLLYLSHFFKMHRREYYDRLEAVRTKGDWEGWLIYFLEGVEVVAEEAIALIAALFERVDRDRGRYLESERATVVGARLFEQLPRNPIVTVKTVVRLCETTKPTAAKAVASLCDVGILEETSGRKRDRTYSYEAYLELLRVGTDY
jgi:cell filamentation protein, protein adenylyltransferase